MLRSALSALAYKDNCPQRSKEKEENILASTFAKLLAHDHM